jgi:DNA-binding NarL/FixJ family response regulator
MKVGKAIKIEDYDNINDLLHDLKEEDEIRKLIQKYSMNFAMLLTLFNLVERGLNSKEIAQKLGIHKTTVENYAKIVRMMNKKDKNTLIKYFINSSEKV